METLRELIRRFGFYLRRDRFDRELDDEMQIHLQLKADEKIAAGADPEEARFEARREFGNTLGMREEASSIWAFAWLDALAQDVRFAARTMRRSPVFTVASILTLALGIGVNTAAFSFVRAVLLEPLPYPEQNRLVAVSSMNQRSGDNSFGVSGADFLELRRAATSFSAMGLYSSASVTMDDGDRLDVLPAARVSDGFFETLGVAPMLGRTFQPEEYQTGVTNVIVSYDLWQRRFGGDPDIVGKPLDTPRGRLTVIGVMPKAFEMPSQVQVWRSLDLTSSELTVHSDRYFGAIARLRPGATESQAETDLRATADRMATELPVSNANWSVRLTPLRETIVGDARPALVVLFIATALVLFIAAANVAHLLLARATARGGEITIRSALGASRGRLVRQLVTENLLLSLAGGALGAAGAFVTIRFAVALVPADLQVDRLDQAGIDPGVMVFAFTVSLAIAVVFGVALAIKGPGADLSRVGSGIRTATSGRGLLRLRGVLVSVEVALTLVLAVGAGLLIRSLVNLGHVDLGFESDRLVALRVGSLQIPFADDARRVALYRSIVDAVRTVPGVTSVSAGASVPLGFTLVFPYRIEGETQFGEAPDAAYSAVSPGFFDQLRIPLRAGREFDENDRAGSERVVVINEAMRQRHFASSDPIGRLLTVNYRGDALTFKIVGVVGNVKQWQISEPSIPEVYVSYLQYPWLDTALFVRTDGDAQAVVPAVQKAIRGVDPMQSGTAVTTLDSMISTSTARPRFFSVVLGAFAALALALAAIGVFGVMSYTVAQRTREIGIRIALGAERGSVTRMVVGRGMRLVLAGVLPGLVCAVGLSRLMETLLYGVDKLDPAVLSATGGILVLVALVACAIPARRAAAIDPTTALRSE